MRYILSVLLLVSCVLFAWSADIDQKTIDNILERRGVTTFFVVHWTTIESEFNECNLCNLFDLNNRFDLKEYAEHLKELNHYTIKLQKHEQRFENEDEAKNFMYGLKDRLRNLASYSYTKGWTSSTPVVYINAIQ